MREVSIQVQGVTVSYSGNIALNNANLELQSGSISGLVCPNGAGKSTLFKSIMGLLTPAQGRVIINGKPIQAAQKANLIAYVPQSEEVDWSFPVSVWDVVMMGRYGYMNILRIPSAQDRKEAQKALDLVQMAEFRERQIGELSGGQKKRAFLARALAQQGTVMLLDEPFTGVDAKTEKTIIDLLLQLKQSGHTILISTHDLGSVSSFCDQVILVNRTILAYGPTAEVFTEENLTKTFGGMLRNLTFSPPIQPQPRN
ncbi:metal ABC transporter ATP-binding protein [Candidatus Cyanaurora vandensis]|uniref:metal ABC transporter ATP-binding protein n=1 Tax=Candidatus Cyanaurora vandensis TaxID=2714958 RepID=UPI00257CB884|nr:metal ABC transporter ATP-binding protein [Candidatus Cyanaurora vandensis]